MTVPITYRLMESGDEAAICELIIEVFNEFEAPEYPQEGVEEFLRYIKPNLLRKRAESDHFTLVALAEELIVGMIEIRELRHISLMFVRKAYHRQGIAKNLFQRALERCLQLNPDLTEMTVNSAPCAVPIYERFGFIAQSEEMVSNGIRFIPMKKILSEAVEEITYSSDRSSVIS